MRDFSKRILGVITVFTRQWPHSVPFRPGGATCPVGADDYAAWYAPTVLGGPFDQWAEVATAGQLGRVAGTAPAQRDCFVLPVRHGRGRAAPRRAWQPGPPQWRALEPCKNRHGRVGAAEYMLASLGVPATGLARTKGIVAWTGPSGY